MMGWLVDPVAFLRCVQSEIGRFQSQAVERLAT